MKKGKNRKRALQSFLSRVFSGRRWIENVWTQSESGSSATAEIAFETALIDRDKREIRAHGY